MHIYIYIYIYRYEPDTFCLNAPGILFTLMKTRAFFMDCTSMDMNSQKFVDCTYNII